MKLKAWLNRGCLAVESFLAYLFDSFVLLFTKKQECCSGVGVVRIDSIGDFILWLDAAKELRRVYPEAKITLIANQTWSDLARLLPYWDRVIPIDRRRFIRHPLYRLKTLRRIRRLGFESVIHPTFSRECQYGDSLIRASGAPNRIGSNGDLTNMMPLHKRIADRWYSRLIRATKDPLMEIERNAEFIRELGFRDFVASIPVLSKLTVLQPSLKVQQPYAVLFPGSLRKIKNWPRDNFSKLLAHLVNEYGLRVILCGNETERVSCSNIISLSNATALNLAGKTTLPELVEVIRNAKILISNDTSAVHIAAAVGTLSVCILGGGHYGRFLPYILDLQSAASPIPVIQKMDCYNCNWICTQPHEKGEAAPCIANIMVEQVLKTVAKTLS